MRLKRHLKCAAVLSMLCVGMLFPMAAQADTEYETKDVTTYLFDNEHSTKMTLLFKNDLPTIPYINATDYLNTVYKADDFAAVKQADGTYKIGSAASEYSMMVDPDKDVVTFDKYNDFISQAANIASDMQLTFAECVKKGYVGRLKPAVFDTGAYDIDILEINGNVYLPLPTMNDLFMRLYNAAQYLDGKLYFLHSSDLMSGSAYFDRAALFDRLERPASEAQFNYNELCFMMDTSYGAPTRGKLAGKILEEGFDKALDSSDKLKKAKTYLKSESLLDYNVGLFYIGEDLIDGGHTAPAQDINTGIAFYPDSKLIKALSELLNGSDRTEDKDVIVEYINQSTIRNTVVAELKEKANATSTPGTLVKEFKDCGAGLYVTGDTALFTFDSFTVPIVDAFKWSVDKAAELGMKNFVVDLTTNNGGVTQVSFYMLTLMANKERKTNEFNFYNYYKASDETAYETYILDLNLDGKFDDADKEVAYDLNFAVLESRCSYSCGNFMPVLAKEMGICVLGENSGGGGCVLAMEFTASGYFMNISGMPKLVTANKNTDVDLGAKPDYELSYDEMYNEEILSSKIHEFYSGYKNEWVKGKWYNKKGAQTYKPTGSWHKNTKGWWYGDTSGWYAKNEWQKIDGKWYYFKADGYMAAGEYINGYWLNKNGSWTYKARAGWRKNAKGWFYIDQTGWYAKNQTIRINGKNYKFNKAGYCTNP